MRRKPKPAISVAGDEIIPFLDEIEIWQLALIIEAPEDQVRRLLEVESETDAIDIRDANDLLAEMATAGLTDWRESSLLGQVIAGRCVVEPDGSFWLASEGSRFGRRPFQYRSTAPPGDAIELDIDAFLRAREEGGGRIRLAIVKHDGEPVRRRRLP